jgi:hypothetical protein
MTQRSQRHKEQVHGGIQAPTLASITPSTAPKNTTQNLGIVGAGFISGDVMVFDGVEYPANYVDSTHLNIIGVATGATARTVQCQARHANGATSNSISVTVT